MGEVRGRAIRRGNGPKFERWEEARKGCTRRGRGRSGVGMGGRSSSMGSMADRRESCRFRKERRVGSIGLRFGFDWKRELGKKERQVRPEPNTPFTCTIAARISLMSRLPALLRDKQHNTGTTGKPPSSMHKCDGVRDLSRIHPPVSLPGEEWWKRKQTSWIDACATTQM